MPAVVFLTALAVRCAIVFQLDGTAIFRTPQLDSVEYFSWAERIASGDFSWPAAPPHGPGYPLFLGILLFICRGSLFAVHLLQAILGSITAVMIAAIANRVAGQKAGLAAGVFAALYGPMALVDVSIYGEGLLVFLITASLLAVIEAQNSVRLRAMLFFAGSALGLAIIVRPTAAILVPIYALFVWRRSLLIFAVAVVLPVLPVFLHNWQTPGDLLAIQSGGGMNFYIGSSPQHDGTAWARPGGTWDWLRGEAWRAGVRGAAAEDRYYLQRALHEMSPMLFVRKLIWLTQWEEIRDSHSFYFFTERSPILRFAPRFSLLLPFAVFGLWMRGRSMPWLLAASGIAMSLTIAALVVGSRYRAPLLPFLFVFAGIGIASLIEQRRIVAFAITFMLVFAITKVWTHAPSHALAEEWAMEGIALGKERRLADAGAAFTRANQLDPRLGIGWTGPGDLALSLGRLREAEAAFQRSIAVDPHHARGYSHLALVRAAEGDRAPAIALLRMAVAIRYDREAMYNLAGFLFAAGDLSGAEPLLREILRADDSDVEALTGLARVAEARQRSVSNRAKK